MDDRSRAAMFSPDYVTARQRFRDAAARRGWTCAAYPIARPAEEDDGLSVDVAASSSPREGPVLVVSSGMHGVEGYFGSAAQLALLEQRALDTRAGHEVRYVLIHGQNPYGFAHDRRCDEENIDTNRNFLVGDAAYTGSPPAYARFDALLNPKRAPSAWDLFQVRMIGAVARHGVPGLKQTVLSGQHDYPKGLFFAGRRPSRTLVLLRDHLRAWIGPATRVVHLDLHTGLGVWARWKLLVDYPLGDEARRRMHYWFGDGTLEEGDPRGVAYQARGSLGPWCVAQRFSPEYVFAFAEFGTYRNLAVLAGLRRENQAFWWCRREDPAARRARARLRELFCPRSPAWRAQAITGALDLFERARGLLSSPG